MVRSMTVVLILTAVACVCAAPAQREAGDATKSQAGSIVLPNLTDGNFGTDSFSIAHGGNAYGDGDGGHGGNIGNINYGGSGDKGHITYA